MQFPVKYKGQKKERKVGMIMPILHSYIITMWIKWNGILQFFTQTNLCGTYKKNAALFGLDYLNFFRELPLRHYQILYFSCKKANLTSHH